MRRWRRWVGADKPPAGMAGEPPAPRKMAEAGPARADESPAARRQRLSVHSRRARSPVTTCAQVELGREGKHWKWGVEEGRPWLRQRRAGPASGGGWQ